MIQALRFRTGFTIIEIMIAFTVLAIGMTALMQSMATQHQARMSVRDTQRVSQLAQSLQERLYSEPWKNMVASIGWTRSQKFVSANPFAVGLQESELLTNGFLAQPSGLDNLRVIIEYHRGETTGPSALGVFDEDNGDFQGNRPEELGKRAKEFAAGPITAGVENKALQAMRARIGDNTRLTTLPAESTEPIAIRIIIVWKSGNIREALAGRIINPGTTNEARMYEMIMARAGN